MRILICSFIGLWTVIASADVSFQNGWARVMNGAPNGAVFGEFVNTGDTPVKVVSSSSTLVERVELHTHIREGNIMKMREVSDFEIPAHGTLSLKSGGLHIMLLGLRNKIHKKKEVKLKLTFDDGSTMQIVVPVRTKGKQCNCQHKKG